jgi:hypothetical protein
MLIDSRGDARGYFLEVWRRLRQGTVLEPLQALVADVLQAHPEYHELMNDPAVLTRDFATDQPGANPFLHLGLHVAVREQLQTDRPAGIAAVWRQILALTGDRHVAEHRLMECLMQRLLEAQHSGVPPDESVYLSRARELL